MNLQCLTFFLHNHLKKKNQENKVQVYHLQKQWCISPLRFHDFLYTASNSQDIYIFISSTLVWASQVELVVMNPSVNAGDL